MNLTKEQIKEKIKLEEEQGREKVQRFIKRFDLKVGDKVFIEYLTYSNCGPKRRRLNNLTIQNISTNSITFAQNENKSYIIDNYLILSIYRVIGG